MKIFNRERFSWLGKVELGAPISELDVLEFLDNKEVSKAVLMHEIEKVKKGSCEKPIESEDEEKQSWEEEEIFEGDRQRNKDMSLEETLARSIVDIQRKVDREINKLDREQRRHLGYLLIKAKEGGIKLWRKQHWVISENFSVEYLIKFAASNPAAEDLNTMGEFLKKGIYYLKYDTLMGRQSTGNTAEIALSFYDKLKSLYGKSLSGTEFATIENFITSGGQPEEAKKYIDRVLWLRNNLNQNHLRIEGGLLEILGTQPENEEYRNVLYSLDKEEIIFISTVLKKFIHPSKFRTEVGLREFLAVVNFINRNRAYFEEAASWENDWWDLDTNLNNLFKAPSGTLDEIPDQEFLGKYDTPKLSTIKLFGAEVCRQFPEIENLVQSFNIIKGLESEVGSVVLDILLKFSDSTDRNYFLNNDHGRGHFDRKNELFTLFEILGNFAKRLVENPYEIEFIKENFDIKSFGDLFFVNCLLKEKETHYTERTEILKNILGTKIDVTNNLHYYLLFEKQERWSRDNDDLKNLQILVGSMGLDKIFPFTPKDLISRNRDREVHYGLAWYFKIKNDYNDRANDERREYMQEVESFFRNIDSWKGDKETLEKAKADGFFNSPHEKNLLYPHQIKAFYDMNYEAKERFRVVLGLPNYDFGSKDFYLLANASLGALEMVFSLFKDTKEINPEYFEMIKKLLPNDSKDKLKETAIKYFSKSVREKTRWDRENEKKLKYKINGMKKEHIALLQFIFGENSRELDQFLKNYFESIFVDEDTIVTDMESWDNPPILDYMIEHRNEAGIRKDLINKMIGDSYYSIHRAKDFVFEYRIKEQGITKDNWMIAWDLLHSKTIDKFSYEKELGNMLDEENARNFVKKGILELLEADIDDKKDEFAGHVKRELQFILFLAPKYRDKLIGNIDIEKAKEWFSYRDNYLGRYRHDGQEYEINKITNFTDTWLLNLEYLLEPEDRQIIYDEINQRLVDAVNEQMANPADDRVYVFDQVKFITSSPFEKGWVDKEALKIADYMFHRYGSGDRFGEYLEKEIPLEMREDNWVNLLNLYTYQTDKNLEGYKELDEFINLPETIEKFKKYSNVLLKQYLSGNYVLSVQEKILIGFLTSYRVRDHWSLFGDKQFFAKQIEFLESNKVALPANTNKILERSLEIKDQEKYSITVEFLLQAAILCSSVSEEEKSSSLEKIFLSLAGQDLDGYFKKILSDEPQKKEFLLKKYEFITIINANRPGIFKLFGNPLNLDAFLNFLQNILKNSIENVKKLRFINSMNDEYVQILKETLEHSPKNFMKVMELLNISNSVGLPITKGFADFVSNLENFSIGRIRKIYQVINRKELSENKDEKRIMFLEEKSQTETDPIKLSKLQARIEKLRSGDGKKTKTKNHFIELLERLEKAEINNKEGSNERTVSALRKEVKLYLVPVLTKFFEDKTTKDIVNMIERDFELEDFDFDSVKWDSFTSAYRMYVRLSKDKPEDAQKAKLVYSKCLNQERDVWKSFRENQAWIDRNILTQKDDFMTPNIREFDVGSFAATDLEGQIKHFINEAKRCIVELNELSELNIEVDKIDTEIQTIDAFKKIRDKIMQEQWGDRKREIFEDLKIQVDGLEQAITLSRSTGKIPKKIIFERELDPIQITQMGTVVQGSCLNADSMNYWSAFTNAIEVNKCLFWAKDEDGNLLGRILCAVDSGKKIVRFPAYYTGFAGMNINPFFNQYLRDFGEKYGLALNGDTDKVDNLVMSRWYKDPEVEI